MDCTETYGYAKHEFNHHLRPKRTYRSPYLDGDFGDWRMKMEDYFSSNYRLMGYILDEVAKQRTPVTNQDVARVFPHLKDVGRWSDAIGSELRAMTD